MDQGEQVLNLASVLAAWPVRFTVIGSTARWAREGGVPPRDLDIVVVAEPGNLRALGAALREIVGWSPTPARMVSGRPCRVITSFGPLDIFTA